MTEKLVLHGLRWEWPDRPAPSKEKIEEIERALGVHFPDALLELVRTGDGLRPENGIVRTICGGEREVVDAFSNVLTFADDGILSAYKAMLEHAEDWERDASGLRWIIPVIDNGDGWICLDYRSDERRQEHQVVGYALSSVGRHDGLYPVANSVQQLLQMLRP